MDTSSWVFAGFWALLTLFALGFAGYQIWDMIANGCGGGGPE